MGFWGFEAVAEIRALNCSVQPLMLFRPSCWVTLLDSSRDSVRQQLVFHRYPKAMVVTLKVGPMKETWKLLPHIDRKPIIPGDWPIAL
jgi:hypothetical protein